MILKIFSPKNLAKILAFFAQTTASFCKNMIITLFFEKNSNFFSQNLQKSQKIVIICNIDPPCSGGGRLGQGHGAARDSAGGGHGR
jgi:hypothetical protein